jgi:hypothetical protein
MVPAPVSLGWKDRCGTAVVRRSRWQVRPTTTPEAVGRRRECSVTYCGATPSRSSQGTVTIRTPKQWRVAPWVYYDLLRTNCHDHHRVHSERSQFVPRSGRSVFRGCIMTLEGGESVRTPHHEPREVPIRTPKRWLTISGVYYDPCVVPVWRPDRRRSRVAVRPAPADRPVATAHRRREQWPQDGRRP